MDPSLRDYITKARAIGTADSAVRTALLQVGWDAKAVDDALQTLGVPKVGATPVDAIKNPSPTHLPNSTITAPVSASQPSGANLATSPTVNPDQVAQVGQSIDQAQVAAAAKSLETITASQRPAGAQAPAATQAIPAQKSTGPTGRFTLPKITGRFWLWVSIVAVIALLSGGGYWFYTYYYMPRQLLITAASNLENAKSLQFQISVTPVLGSKGNNLAATYNASSQNTTANITGGFDLNSSNKKAGAELSIISVDNSGNPTDLIDAQIVSIGSKLYGLAMTDTQITEQFNLSTLTNQWWTGQSKPISGDIGAVTTGNEQNASNVTAALKKSFPFNIEKDLGTQTVGSDSTRHFQLSVNKTALTAFLSSAKPGSAYTGDVNTFVASLTGAEVWVNPKTNQIEKLKLTNNLAPYGSAVTDYVKSTTTTINISGIDEGLTINTPTDTQPFPGLGSATGF